MAYEGKLVRLENGRWARFERLPVLDDGRTTQEGGFILAAVELDEQQQSVLNAAEASFLLRGGAVNVALVAGADGLPAVQVEPVSPAVH